MNKIVLEVALRAGCELAGEWGDVLVGVNSRGRETGR